MKKQFYFPFFVILFASLSINIFAQLNVSLVGQNNPEFEPRFSDIWGYVDDTGREYALIGGYHNTVIFDLNNPASPQISAVIPGPTSIWRDIKVHDHYAYVVTEGTGTGTGLQIIDLSSLPDTAVLVNTVTTYFTSAHNIFIEEGYAYVIGTSGAGGMHILNLADPVNPVQTGYYTASGYIHDVYVWSDTVVVCAANSFDLVDVTDKSNPALISESPQLPGIYAHSGWMTEDKRYFIGAEEFNSIDITVWDLQDRTSWNLIVPSWQMPGNATVHNVFVEGNYAHISYYTEGYVVLNIADPANPFLVGQYNTAGGGTGYNGAWGCYPFLPSGLTIISDINNGLFVLDFTATDVPPSISSQFSQTVVQSIEAVTIQAKIIDDSSISDAKLYYRVITSSSTGNWQMVSDPNGPENNVFEFDVPGQSHLSTVEYYFAAVDDLNQVTTLPEGGSGTSPVGNIPPPQLFSYQIIIAGNPVVNYYLPTFNDTTVAKGTSITFFANVIDTTGLTISNTWYRNNGNGTVRDSFAVNTIFGAAPRTDTIKVVSSNGFNSVERTWYIHVENPNSVDDKFVLSEYHLEQNYPNPFNPTTSIEFSIPAAEHVNLSVYNLMGEKVITLTNEFYSSGQHKINFNAEGLSSGIYIAFLKTESFANSIKMTLLK